MNDVKKHWIPERKFLAAGLSGIATWLLTLVLAAVGVDVPTEIQTAAVGLVMGAVHYFVPPAALDILRRIDSDLKSTFKAPGDAVTKVALMFLLLGGLAFGGPVACGTYAVYKAEAATPAQAVYAVQSDYNAALSSAAELIESGLISEDQVQTIQRLDNAAYEALKRAQVAVRRGHDPTVEAAVSLARSAVAELAVYLASQEPGR